MSDILAELAKAKGVGRFSFGEDLAAKLQQIAKGLLDDSNNITEEAKKEAQEHGIEEKDYQAILRLIKRSPKQLSAQIFNAYKRATKSTEELIAEGSINQVVQRYVKDPGSISPYSLLMFNPGRVEEEYLTSGEVAEVKNTTTFAHALFENGASKKVIIEYFKGLNKLAQYSPGLLHNYLKLSNTAGQSIEELISEYDIKAGYEGIEGKIKQSCMHLFPRRAQRREAQVNIDTHTESIHASVDESFVKLAKKFDAREEVVCEESPRKVDINRDASWNRKIDSNIEAIESELEGALRTDATIKEYLKLAGEGDVPDDRVTEFKKVLSNDSSIQAYLNEAGEKKTSGVSVSEFKKRLSNDESIKVHLKALGEGEISGDRIAEFKFKANTALRAISDLNNRRFGEGSFKFDPSEPNSCGLSIKEMVAICYDSIEKHPGDWDSMAGKSGEELERSKKSQLVGFVEGGLYLGRRGYNIDRYGENEWKTHSSDIDDNKCSGGFVNQLAQGMIGNKGVEIKIVTPDTMKPSLIARLKESNILPDLASEEAKKVELAKWLSGNPSGITEEIVGKLKSNEEFLGEFSEGEIDRFAPAALRSLSAKDLEILKAKSGIELSADFLDPEGFLFDGGDEKSEGRGYVLNLDRESEVTKAKISEIVEDSFAEGEGDSALARKNSVLLECLLCSKEVGEFTRGVIKEHLSKLEQENKNDLLILAAERGTKNVLLSCLDAGADLGAKDRRPGNMNRTALHWVGERKHDDILMHFLNNTSGINLQEALPKEIGDNDALHVLIISYQDRVDLLKMILDNVSKGHINAQNGKGNTVLHGAVSHVKDPKVIELLLGKMSQEAKDAKNGNGKTALHRAAGDAKDSKVIELLLGKMSQKAIDAKSRDHDTALHEAVRLNKDPKVIELLLGKMSQEAIDAKNKEHNNALHEAVILNKPQKKVKLLLGKMSQKAIDAKNKENDTALHIAVKTANRSPKVVKLLAGSMSLKAIKSQNISYKTAFDCFSSSNTIGDKMIEELIDQIIDPNKYLSEAIEKACTSNGIEKVKFLLRFGDEVSDEVFEKAITSKNLEIVKLCVEHGADLHGRIFYFKQPTNIVDTAEPGSDIDMYLREKLRQYDVVEGAFKEVALYNDTIEISDRIKKALGKKGLALGEDKVAELTEMLEEYIKTMSKKKSESTLAGIINWVTGNTEEGVRRRHAKRFAEKATKWTKKVQDSRQGRGGPDL